MLEYYYYTIIIIIIIIEVFSLIVRGIGLQVLK